MPQTRRMRWKRSSGDSSWPPQEQMTGGSSSHAARQVMLHHLEHLVVLTGMTIWMTSCTPKSWPRTPDVPPPIHEPRIRKETKGKARGSSSYVAPPTAQTCVNWDDDMNDFMPPKPWSPTHDVPPPVHEPKSRKEKGKGKRFVKSCCSTSSTNLC